MEGRAVRKWNAAERSRNVPVIFKRSSMSAGQKRSANRERKRKRYLAQSKVAVGRDHSHGGVSKGEWRSSGR